MKEDFLQYVWRYQKINFDNLKTTEGINIFVFEVGEFNKFQGPDFLNSKIKIDNILWAGNIEIHVKSSDWYLHKHQENKAYDNIILHVVWEHDIDVFNSDNSLIPVLELKNKVDKNTFLKYNSFFKSTSAILCGNQIKEIPISVIDKWKSVLIKDRLDNKSKIVLDILNETQNDWEEALYRLLVKNFGLNINGEAFYQIAKSIPFKIIRKESHDLNNLESLFFGGTNLLPEELDSTYIKSLDKIFKYLKIKYNINFNNCYKPDFYKLRPDNFPTIRLSQLANLFYINQYFFDQIISSVSIEELYKIFNVTTSEYWSNHYVFNKESSYKVKKMSKSFIDLIIINTVIPFKYVYSLKFNNNSNVVYSLLNSLKPESNSIIKEFNDLAIISKSAYDSQSIINLKKNYCNNLKCLECDIGKYLLK